MQKMNNIHRLLIVLALLIMATTGRTQNSPSTSITIKGVVFKAETNQPVEAATVNNGRFSSVFTDAQGQFTIEVKSVNDVLSVKHDGFHSQDVHLRGKTEIKVYLKDEASVSVQEYSYDAFSKKKKLYTTQSVASLAPETQTSASKLNIGSAEAAFDGRIAGLDVHSRNGIKGIGSNLFLRGYSSLYCNNQPLVVVDGMIYDVQNYGNSMIGGYYSNGLAGINVEDIENISVVRDAASIYGAKASNGILFIRTSHAEKQATSIDLSVSGNLEMAPPVLPMLGSEDYRIYLNDMLVQQYGNEAVEAAPFLGSDPLSQDYYSYQNNTDWQKTVFANNYSTNYNLRIKGGDDVALYALTVGFMQQGGTVKESDNSRFSFRFNSDIKFSSKVTLNSNIGFFYTKKDITGSGLECFYDPVYISRIKAPFLNANIQDENGTESPVLSEYDFLNVSNPVALYQNMTQEDANYRLFGSFNFNWKISNDLSVSDLVGLSFDKDRQRIFIPRSGVVPDSVEYGVVTNQMKSRVLRDFVINNDLRIKYDKKIGFDHRLNLLAGARFNMNNIEEDWAADYNSANDQMRSLGNGNYLLRENGGFLGDWSSLALYLSADYALKNKYLLSANLSFDGSSRFGDQVPGIKLFETPFVFYPGISAAWIASAESFMASAQWIDLLKIRASYGLTGNDDIGNYTARKYYSSETFLGYQGLVPGALWNPALGPEKTLKTNLGIDLAAFQERFSVSIDLYNNKTTNLFDFIPVSEFSGFKGYFGNYGGLTTSGIDLSIQTRIIENKSLKWDLGLILSKYKTIVDELYGDSRYATYYTANVLSEAGSPLAQFYGYKTKGVYASDADAAADGLVNRMSNEELVAFKGGDIIFDDFQPDGIIDENDMQILGDPTPDFTGEVFTRLKYKQFSIDAALTFRSGGDLFNYMRYTLERMSDNNNQTQATINRWRYQGQVTTVPKAVYGDPMGNARFSDRWIEDGSYARLRNVTVSYLIPINKTWLKYAEIYASGVNLLTMTNYLGVDPEFSIDGSALLQGIDLGMVPQNKMILLGIKIGL